VAITGAGIITALGPDWQSNSHGFRTGCLGFRPVTLFDASRQRVRVAAQVDLPERLPPLCLSRRHCARLDRAARLLLLAAGQAIEQAGWSASTRAPVVLGTTSGGMSLGEDYFRHCTRTPRLHFQQAARVIHYQAQRQGLDLLDAFGLNGPVTIIANACASGANALGHAWDLLRQGQADRVLTGGYDALSHLVFAGFDSLQALSPTRCRPFDQQRDGLALGEGAAVFALETVESARRRQARILGEIVGYGAATDVHHLTQPHPEGAAALASMDAACRSASLEPAQIGYLNAHGTGTVLNDAAEVMAINRWAGNHAPNLHVSSTKSSIGHLLGAAGAVEAAVCLMALQEQWLPPTSTLECPDPIAQFPLVSTACAASFEYAMTNSFGFGGANASLILRRWN
jgi:3-oxoacyl-[acyl-carrier-protein] synthase II